jgi:apolipoprotein N-acyltransferase
LKLTRIAHSVLLAWGWRRAAIAIAAGAASALAMPPFYAWPILFATFPILVWMIDGAGSGRFGRVATAALAGWCFGFGYFVAGIYWVGIAFLVDAQSFAWLIPFAVLGLPAYLALFTGLGAGLASLVWTHGPARIVALAAAMLVAEWLRGHALTGFPWNAFGYALTAPLALAQSASLIGIWGLTLVAVAVFASPAVLADDRAETRQRWLPLALSLGLLIVMGVYGAVRLVITPSAFVDGVRLRIMQPNLPQDAKFNYSAKQDVMARYLALSDQSTGEDRRGVRDVTHLIWPESAFPFLLAREPDALKQIADLLPPGVVLITGAGRMEGTRSANRNPKAYNSIYVIDADGSILSVYDKVHLVPFGEYLPFQALLERFGLRQLTKLPGGFSQGDRRRLMPVPGAFAAVPLICYEIIFPGQAVPAGERPDWMLNLTNDGWFGNSTGPYQHFQQARVRAIEEGLPLVRAANTGISAVVDPLGRIVRGLPLGAEGVVDAALPHKTERTIVSRFGQSWLGLLALAGLLYCGRLRAKQG